MKRYYAVTTSVYFDGRVITNITGTVDAEKKPRSTYRETMQKIEYLDWFPSYQEADEFMRSNPQHREKKGTTSE